MWRPSDCPVLQIGCRKESPIRNTNLPTIPGRIYSIRSPAVRVNTVSIGTWAKLLVLIAASNVALAASLNAQTETVLYSFTGGSDGGVPYSGLVMDFRGNLYGTTQEYGDNTCPYTYKGCGTVFELQREGAGWNYEVLYNFQGGAD